MRKVLVTSVVVFSMLWAGTGVAVLAVAFHENPPHPHTHNHHKVVAAALHGHAHEGEPDHDHELAAPLAANRAFSTTQPLVVLLQSSGVLDFVNRHASAAHDEQPTRVDYGPPPYLMNCVLLT